MLKIFVRRQMEYAHVLKVVYITVYAISYYFAGQTYIIHNSLQFQPGLFLSFLISVYELLVVTSCIA
jgi:hypothetical protein